MNHIPYRHNIPRHMNHIPSWYIMAAMIGLSFVTACSKSGTWYGTNETEALSEEIARANSTPVKTAHAEVQTPNEHGNEPIHLAAEKDDLAEFQQLATKNPKDLEAVNKYGNTPLHIAAVRGCKGIVQYVTEWIKDHPELYSKLLNMQNNNGHTPADQAAYKGHQEIYDLLVAAEADLTIRCQKHQMQPAEELQNLEESHQ